MIKFRHNDDIVVVMVENFDRGMSEAVSLVSPWTVHFHSKPLDVLYRVNWFEPVNFIPDLECVSRLAAHAALLRWSRIFVAGGATSTERRSGNTAKGSPS